MCRSLYHGFRNIFRSICALLTVFLICQDLFTFVVEKPTITSREEKGIDINDIPEVVICLEPGINTKVLEKYGYNMARRYYRGIVDDEFIGWNGNENETKSSNDILEEAITVKNEDNTKFITLARFKTKSKGRKYVKIKNNSKKDPQMR